MVSLRLEGIAKSFPAGPAARAPGRLGRLGTLLGGKGGQGPPPEVSGERVQALRDLELFLPAGQTLSVLGPSGCGKTTLLRVIGGLETPDRGRVFFGDLDVTDRPPAERGIGMVFQDYALYPNMQAKENLAFYFRMHHREAEIEERVRITSELLGVGFAELLDKKPPTLSKGQQQRVAIGRCIVRDPLLFLFDEPMSNVDARVREQTRAVLKRLLHRFRVTSVYVTHDQTEAVALGDLIAIMREGRVEQMGTYDDLFARPVNLFVAGFLGVPPMSFFVGRRLGTGLRLPRGNSIPLPAPIASLVAEGEALTLGVRAKDVRLSVPVGGEGLLGVVEVVEDLPSERQQLVYLDVAGTACQARAPREMRLRAAHVVKVEFAPEGLFLFAEDGRTVWPQPLDLTNAGSLLE